MLQYRAEIDAAVTLTTGGALHAEKLRIDVPHAEVTEAEIAALLVHALGLRDVRRVELSAVRVLGEPAGFPPPGPPRTRFVELNHVISAGMTTLSGLPPHGARSTATPPRFLGVGTFPVRAYAIVPFTEPHDHRRSAGRLPVHDS